MLGTLFLFTRVGLMRGMVAILCLIGKKREREIRRKAPLERGLTTTGRVLRVFSLQFLVILVLFLVLDLEVVLVVALVFRGRAGKIRRGILVGFIIGRL